ncbi:hypothetical protein K3728_18075 [Rhodobacteraceae bacterium M385]|nr:hypothetical protein K3728_18075 [Rhodobacteraceae bacterium M385]
MSEEQCSISQLGEWMVMSLEDGFHAYDKTSGLKWPPEGSTSGVEVRQTWRDGWNAPPQEKRGFWLDKLRAKPQMTEQEYRRAHFVRLLSVGQAEAIGFLLPRSEGDRAVLIPQEVWEKCTLDWDTRNLSGAGFDFAHVQILMPEHSVLLKNGVYIPQPLPPLAVFEPSEARRLSLGLPSDGPAYSSTEPETTQKSLGRPTLKSAVIQAFEEIEKDPTWQQKQLSNAIRDRVKSNLGVASDDGLSIGAIMGHVRPLWNEFRGRKG